MSFLSFFRNEKEEVSLLIDIGNGSIGAAFVLFGQSTPKILYAIRLPLVIVENLDSKTLSQGMETLLDETIGAIVKKGFEMDFWKKKSKKISSVLVSFSSPWFVEKTKDIHISEEKSFVITRKFLESILQKEEESFQEELSKNSGGGSESSFVVIEESIVRTEINGYVLNDSLGKKTKTFDLTISFAVLSKNIAEKINGIIIKHTHTSLAQIKMHTFPFISFIVLRDIFPNISDFLIMDITAEIVEITLVAEGVIVNTVSFPCGKNSIIRHVSKAFNSSPEVAMSHFHLYTENKVDLATQQKMQSVLADIEKEWAIYLEDALTGLSSEMHLPSRIYITADSDILPLFIDFIKLPKTDSTGNFRKNVEVVEVNHGLLSHLYQDNASIEDQFIAILSIFYNKIIKQ